MLAAPENSTRLRAGQAWLELAASWEAQAVPACHILAAQQASPAAQEPRKPVARIQLAVQAFPIRQGLPAWPAARGELEELAALPGATVSKTSLCIRLALVDWAAGARAPEGPGPVLEAR